MLKGFPNSDAFSSCHNGALHYLLFKTSPSLRSKSSSSRHCLLEVNNTPPSRFRLNDLTRMTSQRVVKRRPSASSNCSWLRMASSSPGMVQRRFCETEFPSPFVPRYLFSPFVLKRMRRGFDDLSRLPVLWLWSIWRWCIGFPAVLSVL
jgi:hypothetical protein